jgi:hypothetical protein
VLLGCARERGRWLPSSAERGGVKGDGVGVHTEVGLGERADVDVGVVEVGEGVDVGILLTRFMDTGIEVFEELMGEPLSELTEGYPGSTSPS